MANVPCSGWQRLTVHEFKLAITDRYPPQYAGKLLSNSRVQLAKFFSKLVPLRGHVVVLRLSTVLLFLLLHVAQPLTQAPHGFFNRSRLNAASSERLRAFS